MRLAAPLALALLVLLAGCGAPEMAAHEDPERDVLGWEDGYWHDEPIDVTNEDGLNASEREALVARAKARVEEVRRLEFDGSVDISVISRANFSAGGGGGHSAEFRRFDNAKFEAMLLIGGREDALDTQEDSLNASVAGYYSPDRDAIVIVSDSATPQFDGERTLAHELVHALQDQHFDLGNRTRAQTRDGHNGRNGLIEGDANAVQFRYLDRCGEAWSCLERPERKGGGGGAGNASTPHIGVHILQFFPYSDGPGFVAHLRQGQNWSRVNDAYDRPPTSATEIIYPDRYGEFEPRNVTLRDDLRDGWTRVDPESRLDYARLGQSGLATMFAYTLYDSYNDSSVVDPRNFLNVEGAGMALNETDPLNYDLPPLRGWTGDRLHVYSRGDDVAYRWRLTWDDPAAAERFASAYRGLLGHWGGVGLGDGHWRLPGASPFAGDFHVAVDGDTVTIAHADTEAGLRAVAPAAR